MYRQTPGDMGAYPRYLAYLIIIFVTLASLGCSSDNAGPAALGVPRKDMVTLAVNPDTPLAGELRVTTDTLTRISIDISDGTRSWTVDFNEYNTAHRLPILGLRPNRRHTFNIRAIDQDGQDVDVDQPQDVITADLPADFPTIRVDTSTPAMMEPGYTLFDVLPQSDTQSFGAALVIVDSQGEVVWYHRGPRFFDVRPTAEGSILFMEGAKIVEIDMLGNVLNEWSNITDLANNIDYDLNRFHHEFFPMDNSNFLVLSAEARDIPYPTANYPSADPLQIATVVGDVIVEFDPMNRLVQRWNLLDMLDTTLLGYGSYGSYWSGTFGAESRDWSHANAVIYDANDDAIIVSMRHLDALVKFDRATGDIHWILAPPDNWTAPYDQYLLSPANPQADFYTYHQHAPMLMPNGNLLIYDNGDYRTSPSATANISSLIDHVTYSRAVEYKIDETNMTAELVWQYGEKDSAQPGWIYSGALGDADYQNTTGNVIITHGSIRNAAGKFSTRIVEVTHNVPATGAETEVFNLTVSDSSTATKIGWRTYRSERISSLYAPSIAIH